jgi:purine-nucleoside phosphorylase
MRVLGISIVTDECFPDALKPVNVAEIIATAAEAEPKMTLIMKEVIKKIMSI